MEDYVGPGVIESYTVFYDRDGNVRHGVVVARAPEGARFLALAAATDADCVAFLTNGENEPVGAAGLAVANADGSIYWRCA